MNNQELNVTDINPHQKYIDALALYDAVITSHTNGDPSDVLHAHWEDMFVFMLNNFQKPEITPEMRRHWNEQFNLNGNYYPMADRLRVLPPVFIECIWPLAAFKALLTEHQIPLVTRFSPSCGKFIDIYQTIIVS
jgi:hypothetical protein